MNNLTLTSTGDKLHLTVPYALNPAFRELFKTANWLPARKVYEVKDTTQNRNKWAKFLALSEGASKALVDAEQQEATAEELQRAAGRLADALSTCKYRIESAEKAALVAQQQALKLAPQIEAAERRLAEVELVSSAALAERDAVIAPVLALYAKHGIDGIISEYLAGARRGYLGKSRCERAEERLRPLRKAMQQIGYQVAAIDTLMGTSLNNAQKLLEAAESLQQMKLTGIKAYTPSEI